MHFAKDHFSFLESFPTMTRQPSPPLDLRDPTVIARMMKVFQSSSFQPQRPRRRPSTAAKMTLKDLDTRWLGF